MTRLVHLCARLPVGGMESVVATLLRRIPREVHGSEAWCLEEADALGRELADEGEVVIEFRRRRRRDVGLMFALARRIRERRVDILHCHDELAWFYGTIAAHLAARRVRVVMTLHGRRPAISWRHRLEQRWLTSRTAAIVAVSGFLRRQVSAELKLDASRVTTIANGVDIGTRDPGQEERGRARERLGLPDTAIVVGTVGELSTVKNLDLMLDAVAAARQVQPLLRLVVVGDGAHRERLTRKAEALGMADVLFTGVRRDVPLLLPAFDIYMCTSDYEGISLSILEAMASHRAVLATAVGGNPELIEHDATGVLVPKGDVRHAADALVRLAGDPVHRRRLGQAAAARVRHDYSIGQMIRRYLGVYAGR